MKTGRDDLDAMIRVASIPSDEPTFLLRAQDDQAANAVRAWAEFQLTNGAPMAIVEQALRQADAMAAWARKKTPDASHLTEAERKQLEYAFERRRWSLGARSAEAQAEERGARDMADKAQPFVSLVANLLDTIGEVSERLMADAFENGLLDAVVE